MGPVIGKPAKCHARKEREVMIGTDQRITSGPAATTAAFRGRIHGCTRIVSQKGRILFPCTAGAVHTWHSVSRIRRSFAQYADVRSQKTRGPEAKRLPRGPSRSRRSNGGDERASGILR